MYGIDSRAVVYSTPRVSSSSAAISSINQDASEAHTWWDRGSVPSLDTGHAGSADLDASSVDTYARTDGYVVLRFASAALGSADATTGSGDQDVDLGDD